MNLVLIGYRGTGKSAVGKCLANLLGMASISMDEEIVRRAGTSIADIVAKHGWPHFRDLESALARELGQKNNLIIDCGGGIIERECNIPALKAHGKVFWLKSSIPKIVHRIKGGLDRPALTEGKSFTDEVAEVLARRNPLYHAAADFEIESEEQTPAQVAAVIADIWNKTASGTPPTV